MFHNLDGRIVISGIPFPGRTRGWIYNLEADPHITVHLKGRSPMPISTGTARVITDPAERGRCSPAWRATGAGPISTRWSRTAR